MTDLQYQKLIKMELGELEVNGSVIAISDNNVAAIWDMFSDKETKREQKLYTKRECIDVLIGMVYKDNPQQVGVQNKGLADAIASLKMMRSLVQTELENSFSSGYLNLDFNEPGLY